MSLIEEIVRREGELIIETQGADGLHTASTWTSFVELIREDQFLVAGWYSQTEKNILSGSKVRVRLIPSGKMINSWRMDKRERERVGVKEVVLSGVGSFIYEEPDLEKLKNRFSWARAALQVRVEKILKVKVG